MLGKILGFLNNVAMFSYWRGLLVHSVFSTLGIAGLSQDYLAMKRWGLTAYLRAAVSCNFKVLCSVNSKSDEMERSSKTTAKRKKAVSLLVSTIKQYENPFVFNADSKRELHNIVAGSIATKEMREDISKTKVCGN